MNLKFKKIKVIFLVILFSMVADVDQAAIEVENKRIHKEKFYEKIEQLINEKEKKKKHLRLSKSTSIKF
jgi:hypothetical protein